MLRATGLVKSYRSRSGAPIRVLAGVDLTVKGGDLVVVTGPSGSGKSTLLNVLGLLEDDDGGEIWFEDARVSSLGRAAKSRVRGRYVGFLFQSFLLLPSLTALENVLLAARYVGRSGAPARRRAMELLEEVGVADRVDHFPAQLSGGELVVVTGPSGSGKSTLLNVLGLLEDGDSGEIWFEDARVSGLGRAAKSQARGRYVGFLFGNGQRCIYAFGIMGQYLAFDTVF